MNKNHEKIWHAGVRILAISGKIGSGKDWLARAVLSAIRAHGCTCAISVAFADALKVNVLCLMPYGTSADVVNDSKTPETRVLLQRAGGEMRDKLGKDVYVRHLDAWLRMQCYRSGIDYVVVPDVRFANELEYLRSIGAIAVRLDAPTRTKLKLDTEFGGDIQARQRAETNISEVSLDDCHDLFDLVILNEPAQAAHVAQHDLPKVLSLLLSDKCQ